MSDSERLLEDSVVVCNQRTLVVGTDLPVPPHCSRFADHPLLAISVGDLDAEGEFRGCAFFLHAFTPGIAEVTFRIA